MWVGTGLRTSVDAKLLNSCLKLTPRGLVDRASPRLPQQLWSLWRLSAEDTSAERLFHNLVEDGKKRSGWAFVFDRGTKSVFRWPKGERLLVNVSAVAFMPARPLITLYIKVALAMMLLPSMVWSWSLSRRVQKRWWWVSGWSRPYTTLVADLGFYAWELPQINQTQRWWWVWGSMHESWLR